MELFAYRLYEAERSSDTNIKAQKTPVAILANQEDLLSLKNAYAEFDGNKPVIILNSKNLTGKEISSLKTDAPYIADKLQDYKKQIWNEALTYLGVNNIMVDKKERLVSDEANSNNELINLNLQSSLAPRLKACEQFNELFNLKDDEKISVRVRSDLHNIIKNEMSTVSEFKNEFNESEV